MDSPDVLFSLGDPREAGQCFCVLTGRLLAVWPDPPYESNLTVCRKAARILRSLERG